MKDFEKRKAQWSDVDEDDDGKRNGNRDDEE